MILGVGIDIVVIDRIAAVLLRHDRRFRNRVFSQGEQAFADSRVDPAAAFAKRWAAKEACAKALGTGMRLGVAWRQIEVVGTGGRPGLRLTKGAAARASALLPEGSELGLHLSMSDDPPFATAMVIIEAISQSSDNLVRSRKT